MAIFVRSIAPVAHLPVVRGTCNRRVVGISASTISLLWSRKGGSLKGQALACSSLQKTCPDIRLE